MSTPIDNGRCVMCGKVDDLFCAYDTAMIQAKDQTPVCQNCIDELAYEQEQERREA